jgi:hypothetical protein
MNIENMHGAKIKIVEDCCLLGRNGEERLPF